MTLPRITGSVLLVSVLLLLGAGACGGSDKERQEDPTEALGRLRKDLWRLEFRHRSAKALERAVALARRTRGGDAAVVWNQVATSRLDWALLALKSSSPRLLKSLLAHLGQPPGCLVKGQLAVQCRGEVARAIADGFERAAHIHDEEGDKKEEAAARLRARLVHLTLLHQDLGSPEAAEALRDALNDRAYDSQRYAQLLFVRRWHRWKPDRLDGPLTGPQWLAHAAPYPCPRAFSALGRAAPAAIEESLRQCNCHPGCSPDSPKACNNVATPFAPLPPRLVTIRAALTVQSLRFLAGLARRLNPRRYRGLQRKFRDPLERFRTRVATLKVRVPYPAAIHLGSAAVRPPSLPMLTPVKWEAHAPVHVVVSGDRVFVGLAPTLAPGESKPQLLSAAAGYAFPGKSLMISGTFSGLRRALTAARATAVKRLGKTRSSDGVALYLDQATPMARVVAWVKRLHRAGARRTELLFGDGFSVARSIRATWDKHGKPTDRGVWSARDARKGIHYQAFAHQIARQRLKTPDLLPQVRFVP